MKKLSKKVLMVLLALALVVSVATVAALAASSESFTEVEDLAGIKSNIGAGKSVKLTKDVELGDSDFILLQTGKVTVDLAGHKITSKGHFVFYVLGGELTIMDSENSDKSIVSNKESAQSSPLLVDGKTSVVNITGGTILQPSGYYAVWIYNGGTVKMTGGHIIAKDPTMSGVVVAYDNDGGKPKANTGNGQFILEGGTVEGAIAVSVNNSQGDKDHLCFKMTGGELKQSEGSDKPAVNLANCAAEMSGGTITGGSSADTSVVNVGATDPDNHDADLPATFTMTGGTVKSTVDNNSAVGAMCGSTVTISGDSKLITTDTGSASAVYGDPGTKVNVQGKAELSGAFGVVGYGDVNISGGTINAAEYGVYAVKNDKKQGEAHGTIAITGGTIKSKRVGVIVSDDREVTISGSANIQSTGSAATVFGTAKLNVQGGTLHSENGQGISTNGSESKDVTITVTGGNISSDNSVGVYLPAGTMTVSGKTTAISGEAGIVARGGNLTVEDGTITATGTGKVSVGSAKDANGNSIELPAAAIVMDNMNYPGEGTAKTEIKGGTFKAASGDAVVRTEKGEKKTEGATNNNTKLDVKGGYFSQPVEAAYLDDTVKAEAHSSDGYSYHNSTAAAEKAGTLTGRPIANATKTADIVYAGLMTEKNDDFLNGLAVGLKESGKWNKPVTDSGANTFYVVFKVAEEDKGTKNSYFLKFTCKGVTNTGTLENVDEAGIFYFTPTMAGLTAENFQGDFTIELYKGNSASGNPVATYKDTVYRVDYVASTGVKGEEKHIYVDAAHLEEALNDTPNSFTLLPDVNKWTYGLEKSKDGLAYTVKIGGVYASPIDPGHECPTKGFKDMTIYDTGKLWYHEAMDYMVLNGYIQGFEDNTLQPDGIATRAQLWVIMAQVKGVDVKSNPWYEAARKWAEENKYSDGLRPNDPIQREEIVKILWSIAGQPKPTKSLSDYKFGDAASVNDWAKTAMAWAIENGIMAGRGSNLVPQGIATRAELARFIYSYVTLMK